VTSLTGIGRNAHHGPAAFATTHWSVVIEAQGESAAAQEALEKLCRTYWRPIYAFLRRQGLTAGIADAYEDFNQRVRLGKITYDQAMDQFNPQCLRAIAHNALGLESDRYVGRYLSYRQNGMSPTQTMDRLNGQEILADTQVLFQSTFKKMFKDSPMIGVPFWIGRFKESNPPMLRLDAYNVPRQSWLCRTMVNADFFLKGVIPGPSVADPNLVALVPGYRTLREFAAATGRLTRLESSDLSWTRTEIKPGAFDIAADPDGKTIWFRTSPMKFVVAKQELNSEKQLTDVDDRMHREYAAEVSKLYDVFANKFPTLYTLREAAKVVALAGWLNERGVHVSLPSQARLSWTPPDTITSEVIAEVDIIDGKIYYGAAVDGGVSLTFDRSAVSREPVHVPSNERQADLPLAESADSNESGLRRRLSESSDIGTKVTLEVALAQELSNRGNGTAAMREMDRAVKLDPNRDILWLLAAVAHERAGDLQGSKVALAEYVRRVPQNTPAQKILAQMRAAGS
jgi:hypothetical protein